MPQQLLDPPKRDSMPRPLDTQGRRVFRAQIDHRAIRAASDDDDSIGFTGHAIVWMTRTWIGSKRWGFWEQIAPQAVTKTLQEADIRFLQNHDPNLLLARNTAGTLRLESDDTGLQVDADMAPTSYARDLAVLLGRGDISQMSFAFEELAYEYEETEDGRDLYTITELRLFDVSVVTYPAYTETDAGLRSLAFDHMCRSAGLTAADSRRLMRHFAAGEPIDPEVLAHLQRFAPSASPPGEDPSEPAETTRNDSSPASTTSTPDTNTLRQRTLAVRTQMLKES